MAGIYIHIPFCKQACHYCNFHFSTSLKYKSNLVQAILQELVWQKDYLNQATIETIYFGGGTPSLLSIKELNQIFKVIYTHYTVSPTAEITLEANPDDLTLPQLKNLKNTSINRLSIGIQSFVEADLKFMNRVHNSKEALQSIQNAQQVGFHNLTVDLIYGTPTLSHVNWLKNLEQVFQFNIPHLSSYCLTVEPNTALDHFVKKGKAQPVDEQHSAEQFEILIEQTKAAGYEQYEISNFAKSGAYAQHNSNYWLGVNYLGIGPSAHSFNGTSRQWNIAHNMQYIKAIETGKLAFEIERLTVMDRYNEYILTALRTKWGCDLTKINTFGTTTTQYFLKTIQPFLDSQTVVQSNGVFTLTEKGRLLADHISSELFL